MKVLQSAGNYSGSLKLADGKYLLRNVKLAAKADFNTILDADVARPLDFTGKCNIPETAAVVGSAPVACYITLNITDHEKSLVGQGQLIMNDGQYKIILAARWPEASA